MFVLSISSAICSPALLTLTAKWPTPGFPAASVAVQVTVVVPIGNLAPEAGLQTRPGAGSRSSDAEAV